MNINKPDKFLKEYMLIIYSSHVNLDQMKTVVEEVLNLHNTTFEKQAFKICEILYLQNAS